MDVLVGRGIGEARVCCVRVPVCEYIHRVYTCASFQKRVHAFFEGYSNEDAYVCMRYIERYRVARSDVEESSDFKTGHIHGGMENRLQMRRHGTIAPQLDLSIAFFRFSLSRCFFVFFFFFFCISNKRIKDESSLIHFHS